MVRLERTEGRYLYVKVHHLWHCFSPDKVEGAGSRWLSVLIELHAVQYCKKIFHLPHSNYEQCCSDSLVF